MKKIDIINLALSELGQNPIHEADSASFQALPANNVYDFELQDALAKEEWYFAIKRIQLNPSNEEKTRFPLPLDVITIITVGDSFMQWQRQGTELVLESSASSINMVYVSHITDVSVMSPPFIAYLVAAITYKLQEAAIGSIAKGNRFLFKMKETLQEAILHNSKQKCVYGEYTTGGVRYTYADSYRHSFYDLG